MRGRIDEAIIQLERLSPGEELAYSELLDGTWSVYYSGSFVPGPLPSPAHPFGLFLNGGFSPANAITSFVDGFWGRTLGMNMGAKTVEIIDGRDVKATAQVTLPGGSQETLRYKAELMPLSAHRLNEEIISIELPQPLGWQNVQLEIKRGILVTYLDDEMLIVRDESGVPEVLERLAPPTPVDSAEV